MELTLTIIGLVVAIVLGYITVKYDVFKKPKEELEHLKVQFGMNQKLSENVQGYVEFYINTNHAENEIMFEGITYGKYLQILRENHKTSLSDSFRANFENKKLTKPNIESMTKSLELQFQNLQMVENFMRARI